MAGVLEALEQRYTKELKEYQDALVAYDQTVARAASAGPIPTVLQTGSSGISEDLQRLSTDPFMVENFPDIAAAATHLAKEEKEYRQAVDDHTAYFSNGKCDIGGYIGDRFYEYAALAEMVYKLATDSAFREQVFSQLETQVKESAENGLLHDAWTLFTLRGRVLDQLSAPTAEERLQGIQREVGEARAAVGRITSRIQGYFAGKWDEFKQAWAECGLGNAVVKAGIDGIFLVGELVIGGVVLKQGLKLVYTLTKSGLHRVEIMAVGTAKTLGSYEWKGEALQAKYGHANDNQVGGILPDRNRNIADKPAEDMVEQQSNDEKADTDRSSEQSDDSESEKKIPRDRFDKLRSKTPSRRVRQDIRSQFPNASVESPVDDEWLPGLKRIAPVEADHIVSLNEITKMPGFADLSYEDQLAIADMRYNFTGLSRSANGSKGDQTFEQWTHHKKSGTPVNPDLRAQFIDIERDVREKLRKEIEKRKNATQKTQSSPSTFRDE